MIRGLAIKTACAAALVGVVGLGFAAPSNAASDTRYKDEIFDKVKAKKNILYGSGAIGSYGERQASSSTCTGPRATRSKSARL